MVASLLVDLVKIYSGTIGTGPISLMDAVPGFRGRDALVDGQTYSYTIQRGASYEVGQGVFDATARTLSREVLLSSEGDENPIALAGGEEIGFTIHAADLTGIIDQAQEIVDRIDLGVLDAAVAQTTADAQQTAGDRVAVAADRISADADAYATSLDRIATGADRAATLAYKDQALQAALAGDFYPGARSFVPQGLIGANIISGGSGGTNGFYRLALTGSNLSTAGFVNVQVSGGSIVSTRVEPGLYLGNSLTIGTVSTATIPGLTGASITPVGGYLVPSGSYYLTDAASVTTAPALFQNQSNAAVEIQATVPWLNIQLAQQAAADAQAALAQLTTVGARASESPNALSLLERTFADDTRWAADPAITVSAPFVLNGRLARTLSTQSTTAVVASYTVFLASDPIMAGATIISAATTIAAMSARPSGAAVSSLTFRQRNSGGTVGTPATVTLSDSAVTAPFKVPFNGVTPIGGATNIQILYNISGASGTPRTITVFDPIATPNVDSSWVGDPTPVRNLFPDPKYQGNSQIAAAGNAIVENGDLVYTLSGTNQLAQWEVDAVGPLAPGNRVGMAAEVFGDVASTSSASIALIFMDATRTEISRLENQTQATAGAYEKRSTGSGLVPSTCRYIRPWYASRGASVAKFKNPRFIATASPIKYPPDVFTNIIIKPSRPDLYISPTGTATGTGSLSDPITWAQSVIAARANNGVRGMMLGGTYAFSNGLSLTTATAPVKGIIEYEGVAGEKVIAENAGTLTNFSKTNGYNNVWQVALNASPQRWIWVDGVPDVSTLIPLAERLALQRGATYRLPCTRIVKKSGANLAAGLAAVEASATGGWYWDSNVLYFSLPPLTVGGSAGGNPTGYALRTPRTAPVLTSTQASAEIILRNMELRYGSTNTQFGGASTSPAFGGFVQMTDVTGLFAATDGLALRDVARAELYGCRGGGSGDGDAFNLHAFMNPAVRCQFDIRDCWGHDTYDDGMSPHDAYQGAIHSSMVEYCGDSGFRGSGGSQTSLYHFHARKTGQIVQSGGEGIATVNTPPAQSPTPFTDVDAWYCTLEDNVVGIGVGPTISPDGGTSSVNNNVRAHACVIRRPLVAAFGANVGHLDAWDCTVGGLGSAQLKLEQNGGTATLRNTTIVTE